jgi:hypothetical protein
MKYLLVYNTGNAVGCVRRLAAEELFSDISVDCDGSSGYVSWAARAACAASPGRAKEVDRPEVNCVSHLGAVPLEAGSESRGLTGSVAPPWPDP